MYKVERGKNKVKKNQKGFTLVELLAVIVILAVIILIAINAVLPQMEKARKNSFADEVLSYAKAAETKLVADSTDDDAPDASTGLCYDLSESSNGLTGEQKTLVDRCTKNIYEEYQLHNYDEICIYN